MRVKRNKKKDKLDNIEKAGAVVTGTVGGVALADYMDYKKASKKALKAAQESGIESPAIDITKQSNKQRIKTISKNDWKTLRDMTTKHKEAQINTEAAYEVFKSLQNRRSRFIPKIPEEQMKLAEGVVKAGQSKGHQIEAAKNLKFARRTGKIAAGVGAGTLGYSVYRNLKKNKKNG